MINVHEGFVFMSYIVMYVYSYNSEMDRVVCFVRIPMDKIEKISIGKQSKVTINDEHDYYSRVVLELFL